MNICLFFVDQYLGIIGTSDRKKKEKKKGKVKKSFCQQYKINLQCLQWDWVSGSMSERWRQHKDKVINKGRPNTKRKKNKSYNIENCHKNLRK